jgi:hypothetical protein
MVAFFNLVFTALLHAFATHGLGLALGARVASLFPAWPPTVCAVVSILICVVFVEIALYAIRAMIHRCRKDQ